MISGEIIIEASATVMVGVIFVISLLQALELRPSASSLNYVFWPMYCYAAAILFVLLGEDGYFAVLPCLSSGGYPCAFAGPTMTAAPYFLGLIGRFFFLAGAFSLLFVVSRIKSEASKKEREADLKRRIAELEEELSKKGSLQ